MSVLIKGMEMPTSCYDCNCFIRDSDGSDYCCLLMQDIEDNNKRDDDCPLVPVPPHGLSDDVRSVVRGKWKHGVCQICFFDWSEVAPFASVPNYCPNCGAKMESEEEEVEGNE